MARSGKGTSQELTVYGDGRAIIVGGDNVLSRFMKRKTLGVPHWAWGIALASVGIYHISK